MRQAGLLRSLDAPAGFSSTAERQSTNTPTQALLLINGQWSLDRAAKLAERAKNIDEAWQLTLGRLPTVSERQTAEAFLQRRTAASEEPDRQAMIDLCQILMNTNEFLYLH